MFDRIGVKIDPETPCRELTIAQQQVVEIAKALAQNARIIVMDEPTASLDETQIENLFAIIQRLKENGIGIFGKWVSKSSLGSFLSLIMYDFR